MLKITIQDDTKSQTMRLEGKLIGPWVEELRRAWQSLPQSRVRKALSLDLRGVIFVDAEGKKLLREIYRKANASFLTDSPLTQHYAKEAMSKSLKKKKEGD